MKRADFILIGVVAVIVAVMLVLLYGVNNRSGNYVQVELDGRVIQTLDLSQDTTLELTGVDGGRNVLVIRDGYAEITEADCPDGICKNHAKIRRSGEAIICLPHKLVVSITNNSGDDEIDAVA